MNTIQSEMNVKSDSIFGLVRQKIRAWLGRAAKEPVKPVTMVSRPDADRAEHPETVCRDVPVNRKPTYRPVARGTTFLVDTANLIGAIGPEQAALRLGNLERMMTACGHAVVFFWEHAAYTWTKAQQATEAEKQALKAFVARENVSLISGESDLAILQAAEVTPNSICLTRDRLNDYAETYPKIVGSSRHHAFSVVKVAGMVTLSVFGLKNAIVLSKVAPRTKSGSVRVVRAKREAVAPVRHIEVQPKSVTPVVSVESSEGLSTPEDASVTGKKTVTRHFAPARRAGLYGCVDARLAVGDGAKALELLAQIARTDPTAYEEMARISREGDGVVADARAAKRYARLAKKDAKAARLLARRQKRQAACCITGCDFAGVHGVGEILMTHGFEACARRKAEAYARRRTLQKRGGAKGIRRTMRQAA